jgi:hypothetical protein
VNGQDIRAIGNPIPDPLERQDQIVVQPYVYRRYQISAPAKEWLARVNLKKLDYMDWIQCVTS